MTGLTYDSEDGHGDLLRLVVYRRRTVRSRGRKLWGWRAVASNGRIVATDGNQGYANRTECETVAWNLLHGQYRVQEG